MSLNNKHLLAAAIVGSLASLSAQAQVTLGSPATNAPATYASEVTVPANTNLANPGALTINTRVGFAFAQGEQRNARLECSPNIRFNNVGAPTVAGAAVGPVNGLGSNAISFSLNATAAAGVEITSPIAIVPQAASGITLISRANASCTYGLYDTASQAANGGTLGLINQSVASGAYIAFATTPSYTLGGTAANATAALAPTPAYTTFIPGGSGTGSITASAAPIGNIAYGLVTPARLNTDGTPITLAALLATGTAGSSHVLAGNFAALANTAGAFSATGGAGFGSVFIATGGTCTAPTASIFPDTLTATTATFRNAALITADAAGFVCFVPRTGAAIPAAGPYTFGFNAVSANTAVYTVTNIAPLNLGTIFREGAQLVAPLAQIPANYLSRIVLNNTGAAATFTVTLTPGTGGSATEPSSTFGGATTTASINLPTGTTVLAVDDLFPRASFTGPARGTLTVTANTPRANVNGLYQIVNPATGAISNHVMVAPGTN
ncbi:MAG: hypothetical protein ACRC2H_05720 [Silanimonas sp.]